MELAFSSLRAADHSGFGPFRGLHCAPGPLRAKPLCSQPLMSHPDSPEYDRDGDPLVCHPGDLLAGYRVVRFMTNGGTCQIYEASHAIMRRRVVIKVQKAHLRGNAKRAHRIATEAMALSQIEHPNVVKVYHTEDDPRLGVYIVMEHLEGRDLRETLSSLNKTGRRLALRVAAALTLEVADAMAAFHEIGVIHRDLKPENVFIAKTRAGDTMVKVLDLGIAKMPHGQAKTTDRHVAVGTVPYMAPEQMREGDVSARSDVFSLALVFDEMLSGQHGFAPSSLDPANRELVARTRILNGMYKPLAERGVEAPASVVGFIERCLAVDPQQRPASMLQFAEELRRVIRSLADSGPNEVVEGARAVPPAPAPRTERIPKQTRATPLALPPFACELSAPLSCRSVVLVDAPGAWRFMRIPIEMGDGPTLVNRGSVRMGQDSDKPLPGLPSLVFSENFEGDVNLLGPAERTNRGPLKPYEVFRCAGYSMQFVPPTPVGLGIPPDYASLTVEKELSLDVPSLLVRGGLKSVLERKFPLRVPHVRLGGRVDLEVPLFRCTAPVVATLSWEPHAGAFTLRREGRSVVTLYGARAEQGLLDALGLIEVEGWQFVLIPPAGRTRRA